MSRVREAYREWAEEHGSLDAATAAQEEAAFNAAWNACAQAAEMAIRHSWGEYVAAAKAEQEANAHRQQAFSISARAVRSLGEE